MTCGRGTRNQGTQGTSKTEATVLSFLWSLKHLWSLQMIQQCRTRPKTGLKQGIFRRVVSVFQEYCRFCEDMEVGRLHFWSNEADFGGL